jgi:putative membrane protein
MKAMSLFAALAMVLTLVVAGSAQQKSWNGKMPTGKAFLTKAAEINLGEIELGKLAQQKGNNQAVKDFGQRMVEDHSKAETQLEPLAKQEGVTLPKMAGSSVAHLRQQLSGESGAQFDEMYMKHMMAGHKQAIAAFEHEIEHGQNPAIKAYAEKCLPVIQDHIRIAEDVAGKMDMPGRPGLEQPDKAIAASAMPK